MSLTIPQASPTLPQALYSISAHTGITLDAARLSHVLIDAAEIESESGTAAITLALRIEVIDRDIVRRSAAEIREIADLVEAAADKSKA